MGVLHAHVRWAAQASAALLVTLAVWCGIHDVEHGAVGKDVTVGAVTKEVGWYTPSENDFRREYERDTANQRRQSWDQYWSWVTTFYDGSTLSKGWSSQAQSSIELVTSKKDRNELITLANELGKKISMEWAKDRAVGRISTADLIRWSPTLNAARRAENGSGESLRAALGKLRAEVAKRLGLPLPSTDA
jgi:hypothetical protein